MSNFAVTNYRTFFIDETVRRHRLRLHQKPMVAEICETDRLANKQDSERLYQKMLVVITVLSGLGNPTVPSVLRYDVEC